MKFEDVFKTPRLSIEEEEVVPALEKVVLDPASASTPELVEAVEAAEDQDLKWKREVDILSQNVNRLNAGYDLALKKYPSGEHLDGFKKAKAELRSSLGDHSEAAAEIGVDSISKAVKSPRLRNTEEVEEYLRNREILINNVKSIARAKKGIRQSGFESVNKLSFRAEQREVSIEAVNAKQREINGSREAVLSEKQAVLAELVKRAEGSLRKRIREIHDGLRVRYDAGEFKGIDGWSEASIPLIEIALAENAVEFGIEASDIALKNMADVIKVPRENFRNNKRGRREDFTFKEYVEGEKKAEDSLSALTAKEHEVGDSMTAQYGVALEGLPISIEVRTSDGQAVAYALVYDERGEYKKAEADIEKKKVELTSLQRDLDDKRNELQRDMTNKPASFFNFPLQIDYANRKDDIAEMEKQIAVQHKVIDGMGDELSALQAKIKGDVKKVPLDIIDLVYPVELSNFLRSYNNYGIGYFDKHSKDEMQTVGDFFRIFKAKRRAEIDEFQRLEKEYAEEHKFATFETFEEKKRRKAGDYL